MLILTYRHLRHNNYNIMYYNINTVMIPIIVVSQYDNN